MVEEIKENQEIKEDKTTSSENDNSKSEDLDSLVNEMSDSKSEKDTFNKSGDLSSLITEKVDSDQNNLDEMLESAKDSTENINLSDQSENGIDLNFLLKMPLTMTFEV